MPFESKNAPAVFAEAMQRIFWKELEEGWFSQYFDDLTIGGNNDSDLKNKLIRIFKKIQESGLKVKLPKCEFGKDSVDLLGWTISKGKCKPQQKKIEAVLKWEWPKEKNEASRKVIQAFLGQANYLGKFIPKLAELAKPIRDANDSKRKWDDKEARRNFEEIKILITKDQHIMTIDYNKPVKIKVDASNVATGAVLTQEDNGMDIPRAYFSYTLKKNELKWPIMRKEALAIKKALEHFREEIKLYTGGMVTVQTDNKDLYELIRKYQQPIDIIAGIAKYEIVSKDMNIEYIKGIDNILADSLSRQIIDNFELHKLDRSELLLQDYLNLPINYQLISLLESYDISVINYNSYI